jgi:hypothetical protein
MIKVLIGSIALLLMTGMAFADDSVTQSERNVKEKTIHSTTVQENADPTGETSHNSTSVEKRRQTTTSGDLDGDTTTREKVEVENHRSKTTTQSNGEVSPQSTQEYHQQSETYHQHTTKEVDK